MSASKKLYGAGELIKLKVLWRDSLSGEARDYWRELFSSPESQADIRAKIFTKLKINLQRDNQLTNFRKWLEDQDARDLEEQRMAEDERRLTETLGPQISTELIREKVIAASYARTLACGDFELGLKTMKEQTRSSALSLDRQKFQFNAAQAAMDQLPGLRRIASDNALSDADKLTQARQLLFGDLPK